MAKKNTTNVKKPVPKVSAPKLEVVDEKEEIKKAVEAVKKAEEKTIDKEDVEKQLKKLKVIEAVYKEFETKFNELKNIAKKLPKESDFEFQIEKTQLKKIHYYLGVMTTSLRKSFGRFEILKKKLNKQLEK